MVTKAKELYQDLAGDPCLDFVNSIDRELEGPWVERLESYADLLAWSEQAGTLSAAGARRLRRQAAKRRGANVLARARSLREAAFRVFFGLTKAETPRREDLALINAELERALPHRRLAHSAGGFSWTWDEDPQALDAPLWPLALALAELLVSPRLERLHSCANEKCLWVFLDTTKNGRRRWCDMSMCGNRAKVRAYRGRKRG